MEKSVLWEAISTLESREWRELGRLVRSPFANRKPQLEGLFRYLQQCWKSKVSPESRMAFFAAYPTEKQYDDQKLRLASSNLLKLVEQYWLIRSPVEAKLRLAQEYRRRNLRKHSGIRLREAKRSLSDGQYRDSHYYQSQIELETEEFHQASADKRYESFNLQEISDLLDVGFLARKLRHACMALSHQAVVNTRYHFGLLEPSLEYVAGSDELLQTPAVAMYFHACKFLADPAAENDFHRFRKMLSDSFRQFPEDELRSLYLIAINFGVKKCNETGIRDWYGSTFDLYRDALDKGLLLENGVLSSFAYNNIVGFAMRLEEIAWAEKFIHEYEPYLEKRRRQAAFSMNMARVAYFRKQFGEALLHLQKADYQDFINSMNARILQMKIYYETDELNLLESHLDSMQHYIRRQKAAGYHKENYLNIVRYTKSLVKANYKSAAANRLREAIQQESVLTERAWLLEQLG